MLRVIGLMLVVVMGAAQVTHAENRFDGAAAKAVGTAVRHGPTNAHSGLRLQIGGGLAFAPSGQDSQPGSGHLDLARTEPRQPGREGRRRSPPGRSEDWLNLGPRGKPSLAYAVTNALSLGLDYHYQSGESMNFKVAKVGGLEPNYHSHNIMIEARLEF